MDFRWVTDLARVLGRVESKSPIGAMVLLRVRVPGWDQARPGQFAMLQAEGSDCFLGRALSVCEQSEETVSFLIAPVGVGTRELCSLAVGEALWVLGPLGNGFDLKCLTEGSGRAVLVGGGAGIAPFPLAVSELGRLASTGGLKVGPPGELAVLVLAGFKDSHQSLACELLTDSVARVVEDGLACSYEEALENHPGRTSELVTELLARHLRSGDRVAVCGPEAMARAVWDICRAVPDVKAWFSLEANMACGVGSCHGCVVPLADGSYARVCREGPVFPGEEVFGD